MKQPAETAYALHVNYDDVSELHSILEKNGVEVVISCLNLTDPTISEAEINLVRAAQLSDCTARFIASQWSIAAPPGYRLFGLLV